MDWKEFRVEPEEGMFEKIQHRLRVRRAWRIGGIGAGVILVAVAALLFASMGADNNVVEGSLVAATEASAPMNDAVEQQQVMQLEGRQGVPQQKTTVAENRQQAPVVMVQNDEMGSAVNTTTDETDYANILPSTSLEVLPVVEPQTPQMVCAPVCLGPANDSVKPDIVIETPEASPKSGEPQPEPYHEDNLLWLPNIIVPNGDHEENRYFRIITSSPISEFNIHIYNRGGRLLYSSNDPSFAWNATHDGTPVPQGAYVYVATFRDTDGNPRQQTGTVTVIR